MKKIISAFGFMFILAFVSLAQTSSISARKADEFSTSSLLISKARLDSIAAELRKDPTATLVIEEWINPQVTNQMIKEKLSGSFSYLTKNLGTGPDRLTWQVFRGSKYQTTYWIIPAGAKWTETNGLNRKVRGSNFYQDLERHFPKAKKKSLPKRTKG